MTRRGGEHARGRRADRRERARRGSPPPPPRSRCCRSSCRTSRRSWSGSRRTARGSRARRRTARPPADRARRAWRSTSPSAAAPAVATIQPKMAMPPTEARLTGQQEDAGADHVAGHEHRGLDERHLLAGCAHGRSALRRRALLQALDVVDAVAVLDAVRVVPEAGEALVPRPRAPAGSRGTGRRRRRWSRRASASGCPADTARRWWRARGWPASRAARARSGPRTRCW